MNRSLWLAALAALACVWDVRAADPLPPSVRRTSSFKVPSAFEMLPPGAVRPQGWLRDRCVSLGKGYVSRLDEVDQAFPRAWNRDFHPRGKYLDWQDPDRGAWCAEGGAYWFEGLVRLAWELDDPDLKALAKKRLEPILELMNPSAIGFVYWMDRNDPKQMAEIEKANNGFIVGACGRTTRAFLAYYEATGDGRALQALTWCLDDPRSYFFGNPVSLPAAGCDTWRYSGDAKLAVALDNFFATWRSVPLAKWPALRYARPLDVAEQERMMKPFDWSWDWRSAHGVLAYESMYNLLKGYQWTGERAYLDNILGHLAYHRQCAGQPHGVTVADEAVGWTGCGRGTETCTVAGDMLLYATLASVTGEGGYADHVERSFFNAGAMCTSRDDLHHVYFQCPNRWKGMKLVTKAGPSATGGDYKTKHWPLCCTAALCRILPGYVQWMWMKPASGGLAAVLYGPNVLETDVDGTAVRIVTETAYPFGDDLVFTVAPAKPSAFPLRLRIPAWCAKPALSVNGASVACTPDKDGFAAVARTWQAGDRVALSLPAEVRLETRRDRNEGDRAYASVVRGPLLFARSLEGEDENSEAEGVRYDAALDASAFDAAQVEVVREPMPKTWDWPRVSPYRLKLKAADGSPLELVPYGCARMRVSMFPDVSENTSAGKEKE